MVQGTVMPTEEWTKQDKEGCEMLPQRIVRHSSVF